MIFRCDIHSLRMGWYSLEILTSCCCSNILIIFWFGQVCRGGEWQVCLNGASWWGPTWTHCRARSSVHKHKYKYKNHFISELVRAHLGAPLLQSTNLCTQIQIHENTNTNKNKRKQIQIQKRIISKKNYKRGQIWTQNPVYLKMAICCPQDRCTLRRWSLSDP